VPAEEVDKISLLMSVVTELKRDISSLRSELRKVKNEMVSLRRRKGGRKDEEEEANSEDDPEPEQQQAAPPEEKAADGEDWFKSMRAALDDVEVVSAPSVAPRSLASGSTAPTEYPWENAEDEVS
jgi:peptidoglycan hydrolase CwlO-like protein